MDFKTIDGRRYSVNARNQQESCSKSDNDSLIIKDLYHEDNDNFEINTTDNDEFKLIYHVPQIFFSRVIGARGVNKKRIEAETKTQIRIPKPGIEGDIVIIGPTRQSVSTARKEIDLIVLVAREKYFTHFLCIPNTQTSIKDAFIKFRDNILDEPDMFGLEAALFQDPNKLHLTICMLSLIDNEDQMLALKILQECKNRVIKPILEKYKPLYINIKGLDHFNANPSKVNVLYGKVECNPMQLLANEIANYFAEKGLIRKKIGNVKMHVTLLNTSFYFKKRDGSDKQKRQTFDARKILEIYGNYDFGTQLINEIHLSQIRSTSSDGFYEATAILKFLNYY